MNRRAAAQGSIAEAETRPKERRTAPESAVLAGSFESAILRFFEKLLSAPRPIAIARESPVARVLVFKVVILQAGHSLSDDPRMEATPALMKRAQFDGNGTGGADANALQEPLPNESPRLGRHRSRNVVAALHQCGKAKIDHLIDGRLGRLGAVDRKPRMTKLDTSAAHENRFPFAIFDVELPIAVALGYNFSKRLI
jgi:hypothetical protein